MVGATETRSGAYEVQKGLVEGKAERRAAAIDRWIAPYALVLVWIAMVVVFGLLRPDTFLTTATFQTIFGSQAVLLILSLGLLLPLAAGEFDLSVAGTMGLALVLVGELNGVHDWSLPLVLAIAIAAGLLIGLVNAFLIVFVGADSIIVTLGMGLLLVGIGFGVTIAPISGVSPGLVDAARTHVLGLPAAFYYGLALTLAVWYLFAFTPLGRYIYFVGGGREAARLAGIRVDAIRALSLVAAALIATLAGILLAGVLGGAAPNVANSYLLPSFTAVFLGATAISPGRLNPWGTFIAVYLLVTGVSGLESLGLIDWVEQVFYGAMLLVAVAVLRLVLGRRRR